MNSKYLTPYKKCHYNGAVEEYSIGRFIFNDQSAFPYPVGRIARSKITLLLGW